MRRDFNQCSKKSFFFHLLLKLKNVPSVVPPSRERNWIRFVITITRQSDFLQSLESPDLEQRASIAGKMKDAGVRTPQCLTDRIGVNCTVVLRINGSPLSLTWEMECVPASAAPNQIQLLLRGWEMQRGQLGKQQPKKNKRNKMASV